jgi:hypothetical protein
VVVPHHLQAQVDARADPGRGENLAVIDEQDVRIELDLREQPAEVVVARRPSSRPVAASTNAPVQIDMTRAPQCAASRRASFTALSSVPSVSTGAP